MLCVLALMHVDTQVKSYISFLFAHILIVFTVIAGKIFSFHLKKQLLAKLQALTKEVLIITKMFKLVLVAAAPCVRLEKFIPPVSVN